MPAGGFAEMHLHHSRAPTETPSDKVALPMHKKGKTCPHLCVLESYARVSGY